MKTTLDIILILTGMLIFYQDLKSRLISVGLFALMLAAMCFHYYFSQSIEDSGMYVISNLLFVLGQMFILHFYFKCVRKKKTRFFDGVIGWGDIIMMVCMCAVFPLNELILFFIISYLATFAFAIITRNNKLPLAGWMSISFVLIYSTNQFLAEPVFTILFK